MVRLSHGPKNDLTDIPGILVGHATDAVGQTGVTAVVVPAGAVIGVAVEGSAPGTRETDLCRPGTLVTSAHAVLLCGGSAFGLAAADGAMRWLEEQGIGFPTPYGKVPIVPAAVLYDLGIGSAQARPDAAMGYAACASANRGPVLTGRIGAGTGCTAGKMLGMGQAMRTGIGSASLRIGSDPDDESDADGGQVTVAALVAVNPMGDVWDSHSGHIIAGARLADGSGFADSTRLLLTGSRREGSAGQNTCIGVVVVGGALTKEGAAKVARMAHDGLARAISPIHTMYDGDTIFCLATGGLPVDVSAAGTAAAIVVEHAVMHAARTSGDELHSY